MASLTILKVAEIMPTKQPLHEVSNEEKENLKRSIEEIGLVYPIVVTRAGDKYKILDGRTRFQVIRQLGWDVVPCLVVEENDVKEDDWMKKTTRIAFETELYRRHLGSRERTKYEKTLKEKLSDSKNILELIEEFFSPKVAEKIEETLLERFELDAVSKIVFAIKNLPEEKQLQIIDKLIAGSSDAMGKAEALQTELEKKNAEIEKLKEEKEKIQQEMEKQKEYYVSTFSLKVEKELEKKKKELEKLYKGEDELDEADLKRLMDEERKKIYEEYKEELDEYQKTIERMAKTIRDKDEEIKDLMAQKRSLENQRNYAFEEAERYREDREYFAKILESITGVDKLKKELSGIQEELQSIKKLLIDLGEDYTMEIPKEGINEVMAMLKDISKTAKEVEGLFREYS